MIRNTLIFLLSLFLFFSCSDKSPHGVEGDKDMDYKDLPIIIDIPKTKGKLDLNELGLLKNYPADSGDQYRTRVSWTEYAGYQAKGPFDVAGNLFVCADRTSYVFRPEWNLWEMSLVAYPTTAHLCCGNGTFNDNGQIKELKSIGDIYDYGFIPPKYETYWMREGETFFRVIDEIEEIGQPFSPLDVTCLRKANEADLFFIESTGNWKYDMSSQIWSGPYAHTWPGNGYHTNITGGKWYNGNYTLAFSSYEGSYRVLVGTSFQNFTSFMDTPSGMPVSDIAYCEKTARIFVVLNQGGPYGGRIYYKYWVYPNGPSSPWYQLPGLGTRIGVSKNGAVTLLNREGKIFRCEQP